MPFFLINGINLFLYINHRFAEHKPNQNNRAKQSKMIQLSTILNILYPPPPSLFVNAASILTVASFASIGLNETKGKHLRYSKFFNSVITNRSSNNELSVPSRVGMFFAYAPAAAAAAAAAAFFFFNDVAIPKVQLLCLLLLVHFTKRLFEVLFIHQYSGRMPLEAAIPISLSYTISTMTMIYAQYLSKDLLEPSINLTYPGLVLFLIGIVGNFYHHLLLSRLRQKDDKGYKIPKGGLFEYVICPHYLFEILGFYGVFFMSQTLYSLCFALGSTFYLTGRSLATRKWYLTKFENFPKEVKALIPFVL